MPASPIQAYDIQPVSWRETIRYRADALPGAAMSTLEPSICAACAECVVNPAVTEPHPLMIRQHHIHTHDTDYVEHYCCLECETKWILHFDQHGDPAGVTKMPDSPGVALLSFPEITHYYQRDAVSSPAKRCS